ncbi:hypothetical protein ONA24_02170 [Mycoplasmopsis cynos]|uniref:hypothetical protein n=1 Tax=Mycoplasmopsis cynos TaxID=171284 RepID=UPI0021FB6F91|nr:hypothetical protein [Mycoplasmopsis cynos]UWV82590.1 hypothetical protein NW067_06630 [Mycoplasmopsis cynos]UWV93881.1 hypothetical protein NW062_00870 [Mycoplasmopsis cynos]WAM06359.1 hypothetical protein ONA23_05205 [Mycoplasmopsis cynos]WAM10088.1 hypothetical protein ONA24_02170 [Mycoplasmopsis cynos]WQQ18393.1 hypothetical protein RRG53_03765 [Mycoplasmopsis cynos]
MIFKKRKARNILLIFGVGSASSVLASTIVYHSINDNTNSNKFSIFNLRKPNFISKNNLDLSNLDPSITDINIKELEKVKPQENPKLETNQDSIVVNPLVENIAKEQKVPPKQKEEIKKKEENTKAQNQALFQPQPPQKREKLNRVHKKLIIDGVEVDAIVEPPLERIYSSNDIIKGITNRKLDWEKSFGHFRVIFSHI